MPKSTTFKICVLLVVIILLAGGGILAWQLLANDDNGNDKGGLFGTGLFGDKNDTTAPTVPPTTATTTTISPAPTASPSALPTAYRYPFNQCRNDDDAKCCNGLENTCSWPVNEILFAGVHNAMATQDKFLVPNHLRPMKEALGAGYRAINLDVCNCLGNWQSCHGLCGLGEADPYQLLMDLTTFLQQNENEVVILTMELNSNAGQTVNLKTFYDDVWTQVDGLTELLYVHENPEDPWPTLGELIDNDQRLIAFHLNGPDCSVAGDCPNGLHWYFQYVQETNFDFPSIQELLDSETSCAVTRGGTTTTGAFLGVNNFVTAQTLDLDGQLLTADTANSLDFANQRLQQCRQVVQEGPYRGDGKVNLLYVDFWSVGDIVQVVQEYNRDLGVYDNN